MDYFKFKDWKNSHATEMQDLTFAKPDDVFIFTRFTGHNPLDFEGKQVLFAESIQEAAGYIRHIFLYDVLNDAADDLETDFKLRFSERQQDSILLLNFWYKLGKISTANNCNLELNKFCDEFNIEFSQRKGIEYEIKILYGANELRDFLIMNFSEYNGFDKERLCNICSKNLFVGRLLNDFINILFRQSKRKL